jgi:hypothetical protein
MRYKVWCSRTDNELQVICGEGSDAFEALRLTYRLILGGQGFEVSWRWRGRGYLPKR